MDDTQTGELAETRAEAVADGGRILDELGLGQDAEVLDAGTGKGNWAVYLAQRGYRVVTGEPDTDESHYARQDWQQKATDAGVLDRIRFEAFDASRMPFADGRFDAVFFFGVLHHIEESRRAAVFAEAVRVVRDGGAVVYFEPRQAMLERIRVEDPGHPPAADPSVYAGPDVTPALVEGARMDAYVFRKAPRG